MNVCVIVLLTLKAIHAKMEGYIVGGNEARIKDWPFVVFMVYYRGNLSGPGCGGSILSSQTVLTAAHCLDDVTNKKKNWRNYSVSIFMGNINVYQSTHHRLAVDYLTHNNYDSSTTLNDIGILFIDKPIRFSAIVKKTVLKSQPLNENKYAERHLKAAGWGAWSNPINRTYPHSPRLQSIAQRYVPNRECQKFVKVDHGNMCAGNLRAQNYVFSGDSGGPLITSNGLQIGLVSFKLKDKYDVTVYTHIPDFFNWIQKAQKELLRKYCRFA